jgi:hypothetical protein
VHTTYSNWAPGEPNNGGYKADAKGKDEDCVYAHGATYHPFQRQQQWGDHPCAEKNPYVCQIRIGGVPKAAAAAAVPNAAAAAVRRRRAPAPSSSAQRGGLPQDRLEPVPTPAHTEAPATISMILSLGGLSKGQFDAKAGYRQSFQAAIAQLASFDGVKQADVAVTSTRDDSQKTGSGGVKVFATVTVATAKGAAQVLKDLQKWGGAAHESELAAVFRTHMNNREVSPSSLLVNIGRINGGRGSLDGDADDAEGGGGGGGGIVGWLHGAGSFVLGIIKLLATVAVAAAAVVVGWRGYHQLRRRGRGAPGSGAVGAVRYDPLTSDVADEWAEEEPGSNGMEMQSTVTGYAPQQDVDSSVAGV